MKPSPPSATPHGSATVARAGALVGNVSSAIVAVLMFYLWRRDGRSLFLVIGLAAAFGALLGFATSIRRRRRGD
ncbi:MAG TPA: hypothetical protein VGF45_04270 [Polyangia bacterium]